jgi:hypothetical protein
MDIQLIETPLRRYKDSASGSDRVINRRVTGLVGFIATISTGVDTFQVIRNTGRLIYNVILGSLIGLAMIYAADRLIPAVVSEYADVVSLDKTSVTMTLHGYRIRGIDLVIPPNATAFAIDELGRRRIVGFSVLGSTKAQSFPRGWAEFGTFQFTDQSPTPRPITRVELHHQYHCITGICTKRMGPFIVD